MILATLGTLSVISAIYLRIAVAIECNKQRERTPHKQ